MSKRIVVLGSTGSIGRQALQVIDEFEKKMGKVYEILGLAAGENVELLAHQINRYKPSFVSVATQGAAKELKSLLKTKVNIQIGMDGLVNLAKLSGIDLILIAVSGINGLQPTLAALSNKTTVALANKETLVIGGPLVMEKAREKGITILPVDSEHSAIFQCLEENNRNSIDKLILTASGGPFLHHSPRELEDVTPQKALKHPKWEMGTKITIDSASLFNKGLEVIEAHWLFDIPYENIDVVIHPQSIIHSMVQYQDGAVLAQLGIADMRIPIQYAFTYPKREKNTYEKLDFSKIGELQFLKPDYEKFPGLPLAYEAGKEGGTMTAVYNGANEIAVELFLQGSIRFVDIPRIVDLVMSKHRVRPVFNLEEVIEIDRWARVTARELASK